MNRYQQNGFTTTLYIFIGVIVVIFGLGWLIHVERNQLLEKNKELTNEIATHKETIQNLKDVNVKLLTENNGLSNTIELINKIGKDVTDERVKRESTLRSVEEKLRGISSKLPNSLSDDKVCVQTPEEQNNSMQRIDYIWSVFNLNYHLQVAK